MLVSLNIHNLVSCRNVPVQVQPLSELKMSNSDGVQSDKQTLLLLRQPENIYVVIWGFLNGNQIGYTISQMLFQPMGSFRAPRGLNLTQVGW